MQKKWISLAPESKENVVRIAENLEDSERDQLKKFTENNDLEAFDKKVID